MRRRRTAAVLLAITVLVVSVMATGASALADPPAPPHTPTAKAFAGNPTVGPIFRDGLDQDHGCTGSVLASPTRDLVLTAAHCVSGTAAGWQFVPGYNQGHAPFGVWTVEHAYLPAAWLRRQDPQHDFAILQLASQDVQGRTVDVQDVVGANRLGAAPRLGSTITDVAYNAGIDDRPVTCTVPTYRTDGYPAFNCHGYVGGSSGSPWLSQQPGRRLDTVRGVIGGLHQGGCYEYTSYSSYFASDVRGLLVRASSGRHPDIAPVAGGDGC